MEIVDPNADAFIRRRILLVELLRDRRHFRPRLLERDPWLQPCKDAQEIITASVRVDLYGQGCPYLGGRHIHLWCGRPDDRVRHGVDLDGLDKHIPTSATAALPG